MLRCVKRVVAHFNRVDNLNYSMRQVWLSALDMLYTPLHIHRTRIRVTNVKGPAIQYKGRRIENQEDLLLRYKIG